MNLSRHGDGGQLATIELSGAPIGPREAAELDGALRRLLEDRSLRLLELTSAGPDFCSGPADPVSSPGGPNPVELLAELPVPVLAALDGVVASAGLELALAADVRIAGPATRFSMPELELGTIPRWGGTQRLPRVAGRAVATSMILLNEVLDATAARRCGLVQEIAEDPRERMREVALDLVAMAPLALAYAKEAINRGSELSMAHGMQLEADLNALLQVSADREEGLTAFFEKRPPEFDGR